jgi:hypothetical protein
MLLEIEVKLLRALTALELLAKQLSPEITLSNQQYLSNLKSHLEHQMEATTKNNQSKS